jgi:hypothetical protein
MAISGLPPTPTPVAPDSSTETAIATASATAAAKSKAAAAAAPSATPQDTVTISSSSQAPPSLAGAIDVAPPVLLEVEELLTQGLTASQIATTLKIPFSAAEAYTENVPIQTSASAAEPPTQSAKITP